jgi:hypothetical protein
MEDERDSDKTKTTATLEMQKFILQKQIRVNRKYCEFIIIGSTALGGPWPS